MIDINPLLIQMTKHKDPLHGVTLEMILEGLVKHYGWEAMGRIIKIRCFNSDPSIKSSLQFLRKTPWARKRVEELYLDLLFSSERDSTMEGAASRP